MRRIYEGFRTHQRSIKRFTQIIMTLGFAMDVDTALVRGPAYMVPLAFLSAIYAALIYADMRLMQKAAQHSTLKDEEARLERLSSMGIQNEYLKLKEEALRDYENRVSDIEIEYQELIEQEQKNAQ